MLLIITQWVRHIVACMGGCFGCCSKPAPVTAVDEPARRLRVSGQSFKGPNFSEDFWSSSANDMENSTVQSQRSISSISGSAQNADLRGVHTNANNSEFVNHALIVWNEMRRQWVANQPRNERRQVREPVLSWNTTYESLLGTSRPFPQLIPLSEMVDFLVDVWEQEGLYD